MTRTRAACLLAVALLLVTGTSAPAQDTARGLRGLTRVVLEVSLAPDVVDVRDDVEQQVEQTLREQPQAPALVREGTDKLRLVITVRARNASELRGYWLPFSGTYAIGYVRLEVERAVSLPGTPPSSGAVPAVVWQADRLVSAPWRQTETEIGDAVEKLLGAFLEDHRRARGR
jgi:hypothetical protein